MYPLYIVGGIAADCVRTGLDPRAVQCVVERECVWLSVVVVVVVFVVLLLVLLLLLLLLLCARVRVVVCVCVGSCGFVFDCGCMRVCLLYV